jgi:hypothetical protein
MSRGRARGLLPILCTWALAVQADETKQNVRELCRIEVSGTLMNAYNDIDVYEGLLLKARERLKDARLKLMLLDREYQRLVGTLSASTPTLEIDERVLTLRFEQRTLETQMRESEESIERFEQVLKERKAFRRQFTDLIAPVFDINKDKKAHPEAYPIAISYRHTCSQYQLLCALPRAQAEALQKIAQQLSLPQACERYSSILPP